jgi:cytoskeletal protein CcmA (bactofilin family)
MSMFNNTKRTDMPYPSESGSMSSSSSVSSNKTVIAKGVKVEGDFNSQGDVVIEGEVHGKITAAGVLTVGPEAVIKADIVADEAAVSGNVEGNIHVKKQIVLHSSARVRGDLQVERATIESGAVLDGRVQIGHAEPATVAAKTGARIPAKSTTVSAVGATVAAE